MVFGVLRAGWWRARFLVTVKGGQETFHEIMGSPQLTHQVFPKKLSPLQSPVSTHLEPDQVVDDLSTNFPQSGLTQ